MRMTRIVLIALTLIFTIPVKFVYAQEGAGKVSLAVENDVVFSKDRDYSNGLFLSWTPKDSRLTFTIAQKIYTPANHDNQVHPTDHPYVGYAYFETAYKKLISENFRVNLAGQIAQIGPRAKGKYVQNNFHRRIGADELQGWQYQVPNRIGYLVNVGFDYLIPFASIDTNFIDLQTIALAEGTAGNIQNSAAAGVGINLGYNVEKFSDKIDPNKNFRFYLFARGKSKWIDKYYILQGNNGRTVNGQTWDIRLQKQVYSGLYGVNLGWKDADVRVYVEQQTKHYKTQEKRYQIGGVQLSWKY